MNKKIALVHDDLMQWGGAERVLFELSDIFKDAVIYTSIADYSNKEITQKFKDKKIITSVLQNFPGKKSLYKLFLPAYPFIFEQFDFSEYDIVISQTTRFAKSIITKPKTTHVSYIHTPPRFLWNLPSDKVSPLISPLISYLRLVDQICASRVDFWIAGSKNCQERIKKIYKKDSKVILPFAGLEEKSEFEFQGDYFLCISRLNPYKGIELVVDAFNYMYKKNIASRKLKLVVIGDGPQRKRLERKASPNIEILGFVPEEIKSVLLSGCRAVIVPGEEDFGIVYLEAFRAGKVVIAYKKGGALETVIDKKTGVFFDEPTTESLIEAIFKLADLSKDLRVFKNSSRKFSGEIFGEKILEFINTV